MIISGGSRRNGAFFARHLTRTDHNERVAVIEIRGLVACTVREAFQEMAAIASGTRVTNHLYHAHMNPAAGEQLTPEQWELAADTLERTLGFTGQPRLVVEHTKGGRTHRHVVWSRIDADSMKALPDAMTYRKHEQAAREIERALHLAPVASVLVKDRKTPRPPRNPAGWESFRGQESGHSPKAMKAELTALWHAAGDGRAFAAALAQRGYILSRGDRRDFMVIDPAGDAHSLARRLEGVKAAAIRRHLASIDPAALPSVAEASAQVRRSGRSSLPDPVAQIRAAAALYRPREPAWHREWHMPSPSLYRPPHSFQPHSTPLPDAAALAALIEAAAQPFVAAIQQLGHIPQLVADLIDDGRHWLERTAHHLAELVEDARETVRGYVLG